MVVPVIATLLFGRCCCALEYHHSVKLYGCSLSGKGGAHPENAMKTTG
jgi:hypothetical protein